MAPENEVKLVGPVDWARLAAFIDGEGCISVKHKKPGKGSNKGIGHCLFVTVVNTDARLLLWIMRTFGVGITYNCRFVGHKANWKVAGRWEVYGSKAASVLRECIPYLIIKREQAEIAIDLQHSINSYRRGPGEKSRTPLSLFEYREDLKNRLHREKEKTYSLEVQ